MEKKYRNATFADSLNNLIGNEGVKVSVGIEPKAIPILIGSVLLAVVSGILIANAITKALSQK
jgi:hypothetical protein